MTPTEKIAVIVAVAFAVIPLVLFWSGRSSRRDRG